MNPSTTNIIIACLIAYPVLKRVVRLARGKLEARRERSDALSYGLQKRIESMKGKGPFA